MTSVADHGVGWPPGACAPRPVVRVRAGVTTLLDDTVAGEVPVALVYNGISHAVMLATPADLEDFALGFSLSEGIIGHPRQCYGIEVAHAGDGIAVQLDIASSAFMGLKERRRSLAGRSGCGLCGVDSLAQVRRTLPQVAPPTGFTADGLERALDGIKAAQLLARETGATHAAAWVAPDGSISLLREDIGRHNALDKLVGAMARQGTDPRQGFLLMTSRVSLEIAQKAAMAGIGLVAGMSAPTLAAVEVAQQCGMTLLAFARGSGFVCYTHPGGAGLS